MAMNEKEYKRRQGLKKELRGKPEKKITDWNITLSRPPRPPAIEPYIPMVMMRAMMSAQRKK
jgi:hypothetical protein